MKTIKFMSVLLVLLMTGYAWCDSLQVTTDVAPGAGAKLSAVHRGDGSYALKGAGSVTITNQATVTASGTSTQLVAANANREYLLIQNQGTDSISVKFGSAQTSGEGIIIGSNGYYEPFRAPTDSIYFESLSGSPSVRLVEGE